MKTDTPAGQTDAQRGAASLSVAEGSAFLRQDADQWEEISAILGEESGEAHARQAHRIAQLRAAADEIDWLRAQLETMARYKRRMEWLHDCSTGCTDPAGFEWGIYRVKWENGKAVQVWHTNSDFSDLDAEMAREASLPNK